MHIMKFSKYDWLNKFTRVGWKVPGTFFTTRNIYSNNDQNNIYEEWSIEGEKIRTRRHFRREVGYSDCWSRDIPGSFLLDVTIIMNFSRRHYVEKLSPSFRRPTCTFSKLMCASFDFILKDYDARGLVWTIAVSITRFLNRFLRIVRFHLYQLSKQSLLCACSVPFLFIF